MDFYSKALAIQPDTIAFRRHLHKYPEISGEEVKTAAAISEKLARWGIEHEVLPCHAVIGHIYGSKPGKCVALRADIDALEGEDTCGKEYQSQIPGVCHTCGHDVHAAALLSAARLLNDVKDELCGKVLLIFQPAEEKPPSGAEQLMKLNIMDGVDGIYALHVVNFLDAGDVSLQAGPRMAGSMNFYVDIAGKGGHGAMPHDCIDPIIAASAMIMNLQSIVSRETAPYDSVALTVGMIQGGKAHNSVADSVHFEAAIKSLNPDLRDSIRSSVNRIVQTTAEAYRCKAQIRMTPFWSPLINDDALSALAEKSAAGQLGQQHVVKCPPWPVSEDFTKYLEKAPGVFGFIGGRNEALGINWQNHHPAFDIDESALASAAALYAGFAYDFLND